MWEKILQFQEGTFWERAPKNFKTFLRFISTVHSFALKIETSWMARVVLPILEARNVSVTVLLFLTQGTYFEPQKSIIKLVIKSCYHDTWRYLYTCNPHFFEGKVCQSILKQGQSFWYIKEFIPKHFIVFPAISCY